MGRALRVKHRFRTFDVDLGEFTVAELRRAVEEATSVPPGRQKLVAKGKIINSDEDAASIKDGTTVMVLEQSATGTYGSRVAPSVSQSRGQAFQKALVKTKAAIKKAVTPAGVLKSKEIEERVAAGAKLGYLALNGVPVAEIPPGAFERSLSRIELVNCRGFHHGDCARLFSSPALQSLRKLKLNNCQLEDSHMVFQAIGGLKSLAHLELRHNQMTKIVGFPRLDHPMKIVDMSDNPLTSCGDEPLAVEQLVISRCGLTSLDLGVLARCEVVVASDNDIRSVVPVASSASIQVLDLRNNRDLSKLPESFFVDLKRLWQLEVANTSIKEASLSVLPGWTNFKGRTLERRDKRLSSLNIYELQ